MKKTLKNISRNKKNSKGDFINEIKQKNKEIIKEKETLKELVGDISHQTKTPIANIKLYLEICQSFLKAHQYLSY